MAISKCHELHERKKEIFIATEGEIIAAPRRSKAPERQMAPRSLTGETPLSPQVSTGEPQACSVQMAQHGPSRAWFCFV